MLRIWNTGNNSRLWLKATSDAFQQRPGVAEVFERIGKYPAVAGKERSEDNLVDVLYVRADYRTAKFFCAIGKARINFDTDVLARWVVFGIRAGQSTVATANLNNSLEIARYDAQNVGVMMIVGRGLFHPSSVCVSSLRSSGQECKLFDGVMLIAESPDVSHA